MSGDSVKPAPVIGERLEDDGIAVAPDPDLFARKPKLLWKPNGL